MFRIFNRVDTVDEIDLEIGGFINFNDLRKANSGDDICKAINEITSKLIQRNHSFYLGELWDLEYIISKKFKERNLLYFPRINHKINEVMKNMLQTNLELPHDKYLQPYGKHSLFAWKRILSFQQESEAYLLVVSRINDIEINDIKQIYKITYIMGCLLIITAIVGVVSYKMLTKDN